MQAALWGMAGGGVAVALVAALAERARNRRHDLDRVGWAPWSGILVAALFVAAVSAAFALKD